MKRALMGLSLIPLVLLSGCHHESKHDDAIEISSHRGEKLIDYNLKVAKNVLKGKKVVKKGKVKLDNLDAEVSVSIFPRKRGMFCLEGRYNGHVRSLSSTEKTPHAGKC